MQEQHQDLIKQIKTSAIYRFFAHVADATADPYTTLGLPLAYLPTLKNWKKKNGSFVVFYIILKLISTETQTTYLGKFGIFDLYTWVQWWCNMLLTRYQNAR